MPVSVTYMLLQLRGRSPASVLDRLLNRNLPPHRRIVLRVAWPLFLLPWLFLLQLIDPSPIWTALLVALIGFYAAGFAWVRSQVAAVSVARHRQGNMLVVGDSLREDFELHNASSLPLLWLAFEDQSYLPGYNPSQVVTCPGGSTQRWHHEALCRRRGVFHLGPHRLRSGDPFGLFRFVVEEETLESLLVYPRVVYLPPLELPRGQSAGRDRRRRPLVGDLRAPVVRTYQPGDSLRHVHWATTAHRGALMVTEREEEPSGDLWIVLDLNRSVHQGEGQRSTLEHSIVLAASLAADLLAGGERRAVGLLAVGRASPGADGISPSTADALPITLPPQAGQGQVWRILTALAPVQAGDLPVADLLHRHRSVLGRGHTLVLITPQIGAGATDWLSELIYLRRTGVDSSVLAVTPADGVAGDNGVAPTSTEQSALMDLLAQQEIPIHFLQAGEPLQAALTYRRRRTVLRTTPTGGVVVHEIEEEVG